MRAVFPFLLLTATFLGAGLSCQGGENRRLEPGTKQRPAAATATSSGSTARQGKLVFRDDFSNPGSGWERKRDSDYIADYLEASILPDGRCSLWMRDYEQHALKTRPDFKPCAAVQRGNAPNQLSLVVSGAQATFYVNGQKVAEASNISREGRRFGLFATSTSIASDVRFDNFELHEIP